MVIIESFQLAIAMCIVTMLCWGSWANTQKMVYKKWPFPLFYWDQAIGYLLMPLIIGLTMGSIGNQGRSLFEDIAQGSLNSFSMAITGGFVFNLANILFVLAVDVAGMAIAFPIGIGIALVEGVFINYIAEPMGNPWFIFIGVFLITMAIILDAKAYGKLESNVKSGFHKKGIMLAVAGGLLMGLFYYFVQRSMTFEFHNPEPGKFGPYAAVLIFSLSSFISNFVYNSYLMAHPLKGEKVKYREYFQPGSGKNHIIGITGGLINGLGVTFSFIASSVVGDAIAYGLGQGATMIAAIWGVFIWREFKEAPKNTNYLIALMFICFIVGLSLLVVAKI